MSGKKLSWPARTVLAAGFFFLYAPIFTLIAYSFNASRLASAWGGFSTAWYGRLFEDEALGAAVILSIKIALGTAVLAVILGTLAGFVLAKLGAFKGRMGFSALAGAPLVMPEVVVGLSLLLFFASISTGLECNNYLPEQLTGLIGTACKMFGERGFTTILIGHTTLCTAYVAVLIQSRLAEMDASLEEAAQDLGCPPAKVFFVITLPVISPALIAGALLSFTLSLDDFVLAAFLSGPGSTTLPLYVMSSVKFGLSPKINALATIVVLIVTVCVLLANRIMLSSQHKRDRATQAAYTLGNTAAD